MIVLPQWSEVVICKLHDDDNDDDDDEMLIVYCFPFFSLFVYDFSPRFKFGHSKGHLEQRLVLLSSDHSGACSGGCCDV